MKILEEVPNIVCDDADVRATRDLPLRLRRFTNHDKVRLRSPFEQLCTSSRSALWGKTCPRFQNTEILDCLFRAVVRTLCWLSRAKASFSQYCIALGPRSMSVSVLNMGKCTYDCPTLSLKRLSASYPLPPSIYYLLCIPGPSMISLPARSRHADYVLSAFLFGCRTVPHIRSTCYQWKGG